MKNHKDLQLFNNTKNLQNSFTINLVKPTVKVNSNNRLQSSKLKTLVNIFENENQKLQNSRNEFEKMKSDNSRRHLTSTNGCTTKATLQQNEFHSLPHDMNTRLIDTNTTAREVSNTTITTAITTSETPHEIALRTETTSHVINKVSDEHEYSTKDNNSDSDSALSSAPPSISPQPPPANLQTVDIWQTIRTYTSDIERLQKDVDALQKKNERLHAELTVAKEQILENEKTALEATTNNSKFKLLKDRVQLLEQQERDLLSECNELREQNELLEFRILELEENTDKWSLPSSHNASAQEAVKNSATSTQLPNIWTCSKADNRTEKRDKRISDFSNEELSQQVTKMLNDLKLQEEDRQCLQQVLNLLSQQNSSSSSSSGSNGSSGPNSFNTSFSSDEPSSFELVKSRISDYSSGISSSTSSSLSVPSVNRSSSTLPLFESLNNSLKSPKISATNSRIVATVLPYNSSQPLHLAPNNTPNDSPRKNRDCANSPISGSGANSWQTNSLSESGVFVESDFFSDASVENNAYTQTDFGFGDNEDQISCTAPNKVHSNVPFAIQNITQSATNSQTSVVQHAAAFVNNPKRLQFYQDRLRLLENKLLIYESSGDIQTKRLADRLQREVQLEKDLSELRDRVKFLENENASLEEEKCEFEEAENDTRLRLQRLEIELEILSQRNVELELSKEALSAKYKDCRSECLILRDDLSANETQLRNLSEDKRKAKENFEFLHSLLPLLIAYNIAVGFNYGKVGPDFNITSMSTDDIKEVTSNMGNVADSVSTPHEERIKGGFDSRCCCKKLKEEVSCLQYQLRQCNDRYHEALESADTHWLDIEAEYKEKEKHARVKEQCLKQRISQLETIIRADAAAANEKIQQMEETERELKCCLKRISKEHRDIVNEHQNISHEYERLREENENLRNAMKPLNDAADEEKKRKKELECELALQQKVQQDLENKHNAELRALRAENCCLRKEFQNSEVTNCELREEVNTLEQEIKKLQCQVKCLMDKICELNDEIRTKDEMCQRLEGDLKQNEGSCLALELDGSPSKRIKRDDVVDLKTAAAGLCSAIRDAKECQLAIPQFKCIARDVKRLADILLAEYPSDQDEVSKGAGAEGANENCENKEPVEEKYDPMEKTSGTQEADTISKTEPLDENRKSGEVIEEPVVKEENQKRKSSIIEQIVTKIKTDRSSKSSEAAEEPTIKKEDTDRNEGGNDQMDTIVGMALMPEMRLTGGVMFPFSNSNQLNKAICEVPSELRKLAPLDAQPSCSPKTEKTPMTDSFVQTDNTTDSPAVTIPYKRKLRKPRRRFTHTASWMARIQRMVAQMSECRMNKKDDASDQDSVKSEVVQRKISYDSFYSLHEAKEVLNLTLNQPFYNDDDDSNKTVLRTVQYIDQETETCKIPLTDQSSQVCKEEFESELLLRVLPTKCRSFVCMIKASIDHTEEQSILMNKKLAELWETDTDFRLGLETLRCFFLNDLKTVNEGYDQFVAAITCLHRLTEMMKPLKTPVCVKFEFNEERLKRNNLLNCMLNFLKNIVSL